MAFRYCPRLSALLVLLAGCASVIWDQVDLMPPPDVYADGMVNPLPQQNPIQAIAYHGVLYATDRQPSTPENSEKYYVNQRGHILRLGVASVSLHESELDWNDIRTISLQKNRSAKFPLQVTGIREYGVLQDTVPNYVDLEDHLEHVHYGDDTFTSAIDAQLSRSVRKKIYVYVHGYKVVFENPILVATELWHFLGYDGVMIGYAWPSTPSKWAYLRDTDTATGFAKNFRKFLEYLAEQTSADEIDVVAYSNGTQLVARALQQLALINDGQSRDQIYARLRLGNVVLIGSDLDREVFAAYVADGVMDVPRHMSIYVSDKDKALGMSRWLTRRDRLGQMLDENRLSPAARNILSDYSSVLSMIDVSDAEGASTGNGHGYFRASPWASSDILVLLGYNLPPLQRGLVLKPTMPVYEFPPDYISRLRAELAKVNPGFRMTHSADEAQMPKQKHR